MVAHTNHLVKLLLPLFIVVGAFIVLPTPTQAATLHYTGIDISDNSSSTSRFYLPNLPTNQVCYYETKRGIYPDSVENGQSGTCNTDDFIVGDASINLTMFPDLTNGEEYWIRVSVGSPEPWEDEYVARFQYTGSTTFPVNPDYTECTTCTRIVAINAPEPEYVYFVTPDIDIDFYINSTDVIDGDNVYLIYQYNSVKSIAFGQSSITNYSGAIEENIPLTAFDQNYTFLDNLNTLTATGTYNGTVKIVERVYPAWWQFWQTWDYQEKILAIEEYRFFMFSETDAEELAKIYQDEQNRIYAEATACMDDYTSYNCLKERIEGALNALLYAPPLGYAYYLVNDILLATTTATSTLVIEVSFPSTSPAYGKTIDLDISGEIGNTVTFLENTALPFNTGSVMDNLMDYWIWFLRIMLGFYILKRVLSMYDISLSYNPDAGNYQKRGDITPNYQGKGNRKIKIKSYD